MNLYMPFINGGNTLVIDFHWRFQCDFRAVSVQPEFISFLFTGMNHRWWHLTGKSQTSGPHENFKRNNQQKKPQMQFKRGKKIEKNIHINIFINGFFGAVSFFFFGRKCLNVGTFLSISLFFLLSLLFIIFHPSHRKMRNNTKQVKRNQMIRREGSVFNWLSSFSTGHLGGNFGVPLHKLSLISATALPLPVENDQLKQMTLLHFNWNFLRHWHCSVTASGTWKLKLAPTKLNKSIQTEITPRNGTAL